MGNERSALSGLDVDEKPVEITDFWIHNTATLHGYNPRKVSIFRSEPSLHHAASFGKPSPLERASKNLMLHRHPCILRYISSWSKANKFFLTTEEVKPLIQAIETQNTLQICIGLYSILRALIFLHEKADASHNNICGSSVYVTPEGCWKLGGLEYLCKFSQLTPAYFDKIKSYRCDRAIAPDEDVAVLISSKNCIAIDAFAYGVLAEDILKLKDSVDVPGLTEFREFCKDNLQNSDPVLRSTLSEVLLHPFFTHDFMRIHAFLEELPLKNDAEKEAFFANLVMQLRAFPQEVIAEQLGRSLLSRIVLLDTTAQRKLLPYVLKAREEKDDVETSLFTIPTFKSHLVPKLLEMFCIRDASIRLVLLSQFDSFVRTFEVDELKSHVLPELLVGIKDTNDRLVCATLRALAEIVPILGSATVIGGHRGKLFTDGRPHKLKESRENYGTGASFGSIAEFNMPMAASMATVNLPERPSPDGGEDKAQTTFTFTEEESTWSDWDAHETNANINAYPTQSSEAEPTREPHPLTKKITADSVPEPLDVSALTPDPPLSQVNATGRPLESVLPKKQTLSDISELDIKNSKPIRPTKEEIDFFTDMEPVIKKTQVLHVQETETPSESMFDVKMAHWNAVEAAEDSNGWEEDLSDWGMEDNVDFKV